MIFISEIFYSKGTSHDFNVVQVPSWQVSGINEFTSLSISSVGNRTGNWKRKYQAQLCMLTDDFMVRHSSLVSQTESKVRCVSLFGVGVSKKVPTISERMGRR